MAIGGPENLGKSPEDKPFFEKLKEGDFKVMEHLSDFWKSLKSTDLAGFMGATSLLLKQWFGLEEGDKGREETQENTPETQEELGNLRQEVQATGTHRRLSVLKGAVDRPLEKTEKLKNPDGRKLLFIGDSMAHGFQLKYPFKTRPTFIGKDGNPSYKTLATLREAATKDYSKHPEENPFAGKERALIYSGGNNPGPKVVDDLVEMASICKDKGVPVDICLRFPSDPKMKKELQEKGSYDDRRDKSEALREALITAYEAGRFPAGTRLINLYDAFRDTNAPEGEDDVMRPEFLGGEDRRDIRHPREAYITALNHIYSEDEETLV